ncbi:MAG: aminotransferase class V-fold PLP-dependent enzyme [Elusimicrobia bacterium]|nr:aminotransferase class V-fold PLP-dependent enzyme [Elusimicrobiota bacterium]
MQIFRKKDFEKDFPALNAKIKGKNLVYLDNACTLLKSAPAAEAARNVLLKYGACGGKRSVHLLSQAVEDLHDQSRATVSEFLGAGSPSQIIFTRGATEGANIIAESFPFENGRNEVILSAFEHNSVFLPFYRLAEKGKIKLKIAPIASCGIDSNRLEKMISKKTALIAVTHAGNVFGGVMPVGEICDMAHRRGAKVFVDDAQFLSTHEENVSKLGADMLVFSGHKLGAEFGTGAMYVCGELMSVIKPARVGGGTIKNITRKNGGWRVSYLSGHGAFEAGVGDYSGAASLSAAIKRLKFFGMEKIREHTAFLVDYAVKSLSSISGAALAGNPENISQGSIVSIYPSAKNFSMADFNLFLNNALKKRFIAVRVGRHCSHTALINTQGTIRLSFFAYNTKEDIDAFTDAWKLYLRISP